MIVDSSALVAVVRSEPETAEFVEVLEQGGGRLSAATYLETCVVVEGAREPVLSRRLDEMLDEFRLGVEPVTFEQVKVARQAYRDFGRGSGHPAKLNFGDCFSYALASVTGEPLLYKGDDFIHTDLRSALDA